MILLASIFLRIVALIWSAALLRRVRDWRMGFLTAMLALMSLRQILTLRRVMAREDWSPSLDTLSLDEVPGLAVSVLAGLAVVFLERMLADQRRTHEELRIRDERLLQAQKMEALGSLAGRTAHDFNNYLAVILGNAELARAELPDGHAALGCLSELEKASQKAADLSRQILTFSRKQVVDKRVFDFNEVVLELDAMLRQLLGSDVEYVTIPSAQRALVDADRSQIEQVLINLAVNSRYAMPDGGTFTIETRIVTGETSGSRGSVHSPSDSFVVVTVGDTGSGMSPEERNRAFEPFYTTKPLGKGTGLGLSTCLGIVERTGGSITVQSSTPAGTTIRLAFPQAPREEPAATLPIEETQDSTGTETVLIVEDEPQLRSLETVALRSRGYDVIEAANGVEGLRALDRESRVSLLVTDVVMPLMGGFELARKLRARDPYLPVLFTSGFLQSSDSEELEGAGLTRFLQKPFRGGAFAEDVRAILDSRAREALTPSGRSPVTPRQAGPGSPDCVPT